jgi:hypothetical protein
MCADIAVHDKGDGNPHAHIMLTMRPFEPDGSWGAKSKKEYIFDDNGERIKLKSGEYKSRKVNAVDWNEQTKAEEWRSAWADCVNRFLESETIAERVDHRSFERQGIVDLIPTVHMGAAATQMEKRGIRTERGNRNRDIIDTNQQMRQLRARIRKVKDWLYAQPLTNAPTMISIMNTISAGKTLNTQYQRIADLEKRASVLVFLQNNKIYDMEQLVDKVAEINNNFYEVSKSIKAAERRLTTLEQHLAQSENHRKYKAVYDKYKQLDPKKRDKFYKKHGDEIQIYQDAKKYLDGVMNGRKNIPIKEWQAEYKNLTAEKYALFEKYYSLKNEMQSIELIRKGAEILYAAIFKN